MIQQINQNVVYATHTNSSLPAWNSSSSVRSSLSSIIENKIISVENIEVNTIIAEEIVVTDNMWE